MHLYRAQGESLVQTDSKEREGCKENKDKKGIVDTVDSRY